MAAGPRFLSVGLIIMPSFAFSCFNTDFCSGVRFRRLRCLFLLIRLKCFSFSSFSKAEILLREQVAGANLCL